MLLTITSTTAPATDLGYLLGKDPARFQTFDFAFGKAHVFYPEALPERCTAALLLDIDPIGLVRNQRGALEQYVNDRPYVASSFLSVALGQVYRSALAGTSRERQSLADTALPYTARLSVARCRGGEAILRRVFEPLGYAVSAISHNLDDEHLDWGTSDYFTVTLTATLRLSEMLTHLYVLIPVLDDKKHYWIGDDEVAKLLRHGEGWLATHPERELIAFRYLKFRSLATEALAQLADEDDPNPDEAVLTHTEEEANLERRLNLHEQRLGEVMATLKDAGVRRVLDLGCGEGKLLRMLLADGQFEEIVGMDVSHRALEVAEERLRIDQMPPAQKRRIHLIHGALTYRDARLNGYDGAAAVEVIEHLDVSRLAAFERTLFEFARPGMVVCTTPNAEYNVKFPGLAAGQFRHKDHRFEWTRLEFETWANGVATRHGYRAQFRPIGPEDPQVGAPSQMGVFTR